MKEELLLKLIDKLLNAEEQTEKPKIGRQFIGEEVIIRTYSAGVWFGRLTEKEGNEVILAEARRMWQWKCKESISLSGIAQYGIDQSESKIAPAVGEIWLEAIEIILLTAEAKESIRSAKNAEAR